MSDFAGFVAALPKAELHLRIEGNFELGLMFVSAGRSGPIRSGTVSGR